MIENYFAREIDTPIGRLTVVCKDKFIIRLFFSIDNREAAFNLLEKKVHICWSGPNVTADLCEKELLEYFEGKRSAFTFPALLSGTPFELKIWSALQKIPYGEKTSYEELAKMAGVQGARATGNAVGKNPVPIIVPCHRVLRKDGTIGSFRGGTDVKRFLLRLEDVNR